MKLVSYLDKTVENKIRATKHNDCVLINEFHKNVFVISKELKNKLGCLSVISVLKLEVISGTSYPTILVKSKTSKGESNMVSDYNDADALHVSKLNTFVGIETIKCLDISSQSKKIIDWPNYVCINDDTTPIIMNECQPYYNYTNYILLCTNSDTSTFSSFDELLDTLHSIELSIWHYNNVDSTDSIHYVPKFADNSFWDNCQLLGHVTILLNTLKYFLNLNKMNDNMKLTTPGWYHIKDPSSTLDLNATLGQIKCQISLVPFKED